MTKNEKLDKLIEHHNFLEKEYKNTNDEFNVLDDKIKSIVTAIEGLSKVIKTYGGPELYVPKLNERIIKKRGVKKS